LANFSKEFYHWLLIGHNEAQRFGYLPRHSFVRWLCVLGLGLSKYLVVCWAFTFG
jgi:hypothetical protein